MAAIAAALDAVRRTASSHGRSVPETSRSRRSRRDGSVASSAFAGDIATPQLAARGPRAARMRDRRAVGMSTRAVPTADVRGTMNSLRPRPTIDGLDVVPQCSKASTRSRQLSDTCGRGTCSRSGRRPPSAPAFPSRSRPQRARAAVVDLDSAGFPRAARTPNATTWSPAATGARPRRVKCSNAVEVALHEPLTPVVPAEGLRAVHRACRGAVHSICRVELGEQRLAGRRGSRPRSRCACIGSCATIGLSRARRRATPPALAAVLLEAVAVHRRQQLVDRHVVVGQLDGVLLLEERPQPVEARRSSGGGAARGWRPPRRRSRARPATGWPGTVIRPTLRNVFVSVSMNERRKS